MALYEFNKLDTTSKANAVWDGVIIGDREEDSYRILLYALDSFYIEVFYEKSKNEIVRFRSFSTTTLLEPYLNKINLNGKF